ncbi:MAG: hypothetical protein ACYCW6_00945 [Candidatus Xenobia bacterium]
MIQMWAERRGGRPAVQAGQPCILLPGNRAADVREATWGELFHLFDHHKLAFVCQDPSAGVLNLEFRFIDRSQVALHR